MPIVFTIAAILVGFFIGGFEASIITGLVVGVASLYFLFKHRINVIEDEVARLRDVLSKDWAARNNSNRLEPEERPDDLDIELKLGSAPVEKEPAAVLNEVPDTAAEQVVVKKADDTAHTDLGWQEPTPGKLDELLTTAARRVKSYFTDGNLFVRVGILVLFFGVAFLLKYAAEHSNIPVEVRYIAAAMGGLFLLAAGWRLRTKNSRYALLLQGAGIGIIFITIFAAYRLQGLIPSAMAFALLAAFSVASASLAVLQNSRALASFGILGGFLAPLLTSSGSGNYVGLFSYYLLLDLAVLGVAWYKSWRPLNLIGFIFTFGVFSLWVGKSYRPEMLPTADPFLLLFFVIYSAIGVLYALRSPLKLRGYVDGTLVFGTPLIASGLQMALVRHTDYGIAMSAAGLGLYYIVLTRFLWQRHGEGLRLLAEAMLAVGVIFLTLAVPYALDGHWTTAIWSFEAAGILWVAIRQERKYLQYFALSLQLGAALLFVASNAGDFGTTPFINPAFMGGVFVALGSLITAWQLYRLNKSDPESPVGKTHLFFYVWGTVWWLVCALLQIEHYVDAQDGAAVILFTVTAYLLMHLSIQRHWQWEPAEITALLLIPTLYLVGGHATALHQHALMMPDLLCWMPAIAASYYILRQLESGKRRAEVFEWLYLAWLAGLTLLFSIELDWRFSYADLELGDAWQGVMPALLPLLVLHGVRRSEWGALGRFGLPLKRKIIVAFGLGLALWSIGTNLTNAGGAAPLPYLPLLNPIDLVHVFYLLFFARCIAEIEDNPALKQQVVMLVGAICFIWINSMLLRSLHHYLDIPYRVESMLHSITAQIAISILWTVLGCLAMLFASRRGLRRLWIVGGSLVGVVLVKMVTIDLGASGTVERIISFLVVGSMLVGLGYFSPIPVKSEGLERDD